MPGFNLHSWSLIEIHFNGFTFDKLQPKYIITEKKIFALQIQTFYTILFFFMKYFRMFNISSTAITS